METNIQAWLIDAGGVSEAFGSRGRAGETPPRPGLRVKVAGASLERLQALAEAAGPLGIEVRWDWGASGGTPGAERPPGPLPVPEAARVRNEPPGRWSQDAADGQGLMLGGSQEQLQALVERWQDLDPQAALALEAGLRAGLSRPERFRARGTVYPLARFPYLLGILNVTTDSFYSGARHFGTDAALRRAEQVAREGGDWIEVGGESARGGTPLSPEAEAERVAPVVAALRARIPLPVAVDTYKPQVARAAVEAGASLINDISGGADPEMFRVARETGAALVLMHLTARPKEEYEDPGYPSTLDAVRWFLGERLALAREAGVEEEQLLVDPGLNFGKHPRRDLEIMRSLKSFSALGRPLYLATSRKDYLRDLLGLPPEELLEATEAAVAFAVLQGVQLFRVHDVAAVARVRAVAWAIHEAVAAGARG
ncbi:hypothetical protein LIP_0132 [Limnochorda pilosa]|uniref:Dihydropteroate synthase n=2 Tax=Limnochorda pilosa TaxID=1555112 RepID=A0A0K2SGL7_LIMPI|nr:hypothetical protein LIP_0132 [Limnochorda pilosa]